MKAGKSKNTALLRTLANKDGLNFATRRLLRDLKEVEENSIPTVGVTARPLDDNLFNWHANIKGPEGTPYEGGVFHFNITIPESYPHMPPTVTLFQTIPHPNVFDTRICLDMLESNRDEAQGWTSGYTILSILIQLQSFLFANNLENDPVKIQAIKKAVQDHNDYKCKVKHCKHGGKLACFPPFNTKENDLEAFKIIESEKSLFEKELVCYHTKMDYKETCLGIGLSITRVPRSGHIKQASCCLDYVSIKAFIKEGIRRSVDNERFTNWMPLYFGGKDLDRSLYLAQKAISMLYTNNTKRFKEEMITDVFPKILITLSYLMMDEKRHSSIRLIRIFSHVHCLFLAFLKAYPKTQEEIEKKIKDFVSDESKRNKDVVPNLGSFLSTFLVSDESKMQDASKIYFLEQLDRQVFWIIKQVPELVDEKNDKSLEEKRATLTFKAEQVGYQIMCFWKMIIRIIKKDGAEKNISILELYQNNLGKLPNKLEDEIQKGCFEILQKVKSYQTYFEYCGLEKKENSEINELLKVAIKNSKEKKYHGCADEINTLPSTEEQMNQLLSNVPQLQDFIDTEKKTVKPTSEEQWKKACSDRFIWIRDILEVNKDAKPCELIWVGRKLMKEGNEKPEDRLQVQKNKFLNAEINNWYHTATIGQCLEEKTTWEKLFIKLDLEYHLLYMDYNPNFNAFYDKLKYFKDHVSSLIVPMINLTYLKSGYHYLTALLSNLTSLKNLEIVGLPNVTGNALNLKLFKCLSKGFSNFTKAGGKLERLEYYNIQSVAGNTNELSEKIFQPILQMIELASLTLSKNSLINFNGGKYLGNFITVQKNLIELDLSYANINASHAKEIADGLMRAKQLQRLDLSGNTNIQAAGLASIVYNLAFSPKLNTLNISNCGNSASNAQVVESLYKLLRISGSLEVLLLNNCGTLNNLLTKEFFVSLGEIKTLKVLDISYSGNITNSTQITQLGMSIAFNARKFGTLEVVNMEGVMNNYSGISELYRSMMVSESDHENWYGDSSKVSKMSGQDFMKVYYNNLKILNFKRSQTLASSFNLLSFKKQYNPQEPDVVKLYKTSKNLVNLQLESCSLSKCDADLLTLCLDPSTPNFCSNIKVLNLSRNQLGKEGAKIISTIFVTNNIIEVFDISKNKIGVAGAQALAHALEKNHSVKVLNIFANTIDVDGARAFEKCLSSNSTLEMIDFGHNRLRDEGILALAKGISANKTSALKSLALRFNFVSEEGFSDFLKMVLKNGKCPLKEIFLKNNSINEYGLYNLKKTYDSLNIPIFLDIFDKIKYTDSEKIQRTVWVSPRICNSSELKLFFEKTIKAGIVLDIRERQGPKWPNRSQTENKFFFVEFAHSTSVVRSLNAVSRKETFINGRIFKVFKGGSGTYLYSQIKKKSNGNPRTNVALRAGGRGGYRGRGRPRGRYPRGGGRGMDRGNRGSFERGGRFERRGSIN